MSSTIPTVPQPESSNRKPGPVLNRPAELDDAVAEIGADLVNAFQALLAQIPGTPHRPQDLAHKLGINKDLSSRILKVTQNKDPIAVTHAMPGPDPLRRLIRAAARKGASDEVAAAAENSVRRFESLIRNVAGDRGGLDTIISAWLPEVREKAELLSKQAVFRGMSQIKGTSAEVEFVTRFVHPAVGGRGRDYVLLSGLLGLRRLRPGTTIAIANFRLHPAAGFGECLTLDGETADNQHDVILKPFCSSPLPRFDIRETDVTTYMTLDGDKVGLQSATDVTWAHVHKSCDIRGVFSTVNTPTRKGVYDLFIHRDVTSPVEPVLEIYDTTEQGIASFRDSARAPDRLDLKAHIDFLGTGASRFRCTEVPRYMEMIEYVCDKMNWNASEFRGYRCAIEYPVYGSQVIMAFDPALAETQG